MDFNDVLTQRLVAGSHIGVDATVAQLAQHRMTLAVSAGPDKGQRAEVESASLVIGTAANSDLRLTDDTISRHHCEISVRGGRYVIRDLQSTNGTRVEGIEILEAVLEPGARIKLGETELVFDSSHRWLAVGESSSDRFGELFGKSTAMHAVFGVLERVSASRLTCLLIGDTGTGKELAARSIHALGLSSQGPFVVLDCGAVNENLIESDLFGHERGAFTGAMRERAGCFEQANGGTVFLDEIGELPLALQPKLLRVLERREVTRVGSSEPRDVSVRIVAATHRDLWAMVEAGTFREDLFFRLAEVAVRIPSLRERPDDIPFLAAMILESDSRPGAAVARSFSEDATDWLTRQKWPGNVRELRNVVRRAAALSADPIIGRQLLVEMEAMRPRSEAALGDDESESVELASHLAIRDARQGWIEGLEKAYLEALQRRFADQYDAAAVHAGLHRKSLIRLMRQHGLDPGQD